MKGNRYDWKVWIEYKNRILLHFMHIPIKKYCTIDVSSYLHCRNAPLGHESLCFAYWTEEGLSRTYVTPGEGILQTLLTEGMKAGKDFRLSEMPFMIFI